MIFFMTPFGEFIFYLIALTIIILFLRLILFLIERFILKRKLITDKNIRAIGLTSILIIFVGSGILEYFDHYRKKQFYIDEWNAHTLIQFPGTVKVLEHSYGYPDMSAEYGATALFKLSQSDYQEFKKRFMLDSSYRKAQWIQSDELEKVLTRCKLTETDFDLKLRKQDKRGECQIGFLDKNNWILFDAETY
ncbi:MAG: hypothetical protein LH473_07455 [Chitinophagales bacterium]|nr:hypothetical protein [Chitinophagales bacterium]